MKLWLMVTIALAISLASMDVSFQLMAIALFVISEIDRAVLRIPDAFTKPALFSLSIVTLDDVHTQITALVWLIAMYLVTHYLPTALGRGDIKLIGVLILINSHLGNRAPLFFLMSLLFLASLFALPGSYLARRKGVNYPFAPAISGAALVLFGITGSGAI